MHLLKGASGAVVSVEYLDDVATQSADATIVEQAKAGTSKNPIANTSAELWKTFANWLDAIDAGQLDPNKTTFILTVKPGHAGEIAGAFSAAQDETSASAVIDAARKKFAKILGAASSRSSARPHLERVFSADVRLLAQLVARFELQRTSEKVGLDVQAAMKTMPISPAKATDAAEQMLGWVQARLQERFESGLTPAVGVDEFFAELTSVARTIDRDTILRSFTPPPSKEEIEAQIPGRTFIQQLAIIHCDYEEQVRAATMYLRASTDRTRWSEDGTVHARSWDDYEEALKNQWHSHKTTASLTHRDLSPEERGKVVLSQCSACLLNVQGAEPPAYFTPGSFHALADDEEIGWHPEYKAALQAHRAADRKRAS